MNLSTDVKTHVIITYSKTHYPITAEQEIKLRKKSLDEEIIIEGSVVKVKNIAEVVTTAKYYETFPEKRNTNYGQPYSEVQGNVFTRAATNGRERFLKGFRRVST